MNAAPLIAVLVVARSLAAQQSGLGPGPQAVRPGRIDREREQCGALLVGQ